MDRERSGVAGPLHAFVFGEVSIPQTRQQCPRFGGWAEAPWLFRVGPVYYSNSALKVNIQLMRVKSYFESK